MDIDEYTEQWPPKNIKDGLERAREAALEIGSSRSSDQASTAMAKALSNFHLETLDVKELRALEKRVQAILVARGESSGPSSLQPVPQAMIRAAYNLNEGGTLKNRWHLYLDAVRWRESLGAEPTGSAPPSQSKPTSETS